MLDLCFVNDHIFTHSQVKELALFSPLSQALETSMLLTCSRSRTSMTMSQGSWRAHTLPASQRCWGPVGQLV
uniref:Uncharacterized protein n=1 Tax=Sinocyclocheilus anshuiensis TaxID=1608454 RepID=A0A671Q0D0_9TELE